MLKRWIFSLFGALLALVGCASLTATAIELEDPCQDSSNSRPMDLFDGQIDFLLRSYYPVNYLDDDRQRWLLSRFSEIQDRDSGLLTNRFNALASFEQECLNAVYKSEGSLDGRKLALQDYDADGVPDYRINFNGEFIENDSDVDSDGVDNVLDVQPFNAEATEVLDTDGDGIADHLDWSNTSLYTVDQQAQLGQQRLNDELGVLLVEGNQPFDPAAVKVVEDVMFKTFGSRRDVFREKAAIKYIFSARQPYIVSGSQYFGEVPAGLRRMYLYDMMFNTLDDEESVIAAYLTMVHEAVHGLQYAMDLPDNLPSLLARNVHEVAPNFVAELNNLHWQIDMNEPVKPTKVIYKGFTFNEVEHTAFAQIYGQGDLAIPISELEEMYYSDEEIDERYGVFNVYSLGNIWEWHAEYVTASVFDRIYKAAERALDADEYTAIRACAEAKLLKLYTEDYTYKLERAEPQIMAKLEALYPISDEDLDYLANTYIIEPFTSCANG